MDSGVFIKDFKDGQQILRFFELRGKTLRKTRGGQPYLDLKFGDSSGEITAKLWPESLKKWGQTFDLGDIVKVEGRIEAFQDRSQLIVDKIRKAEESEVPDISTIIRTTECNVDEVFDQMVQLAENPKPSELSHFVLEILERVCDPFKSAPAARMIHHAYRGGLIEHTWSVVRKVLAILETEPGFNSSIAIAGAMLHDIGKLQEISSGTRSRTLEGRLIGHVILGVTFVRSVALELGLENEPWLVELEHMLLSHHGEPGFGSPVRPFTREAILVHFVDNLDSRLKIMEEALESVDSDGFSQYNKWLEGRAYAGASLKPMEEENV